MDVNTLQKCGLMLMVLMLTACGNSARTYRLGTSDQEQAYRDLGKALQAELQRRSNMRLNTVETQGSLDNLQRLRRGELDFAFVQGGFVFDDAGLLMVAAVDTEYLHIVVPMSSNIRDLSDLAGQRVAAGIEGSGSRQLAERIVEAANFAPPTQLIPTTRESIAAQLIGGDVNAAMFVSNLRRELEPLFAGGQFRLVGIQTANALSMLLFDVEKAVIPSGIYGKNLSLPPTPTPSLAVKTKLAVRADVPNRIVTHVIEALFDHRVRQDARLPKLTERAARRGITRKLHPAAESYYARNDPISSDQFEIAGVLLAVLIALLSAIRYVWDWYGRKQGQGGRQVDP